MVKTKILANCLRCNSLRWIFVLDGASSTCRKTLSFSSIDVTSDQKYKEKDK